MYSLDSASSLNGPSVDGIVDQHCLSLLASYRPKDLIGIYGDMTGQYHRDIDSQSSITQVLFDQGMLHTYGFNKVEGIRNFQAAVVEDPNCAMCHFGIAYANGPNINTDVSKQMAIDGKKHIQLAIKIMDSKKDAKNDENERIGGVKNEISVENIALILAQEKKFSFQNIEEWIDQTQKFYDLKYVEAMKQMNKNFPKDIDIAVMYAESIINLSPWLYYIPHENQNNRQYIENKIPKIREFTDIMKSAVVVLQKAIAESPLHPLALHLWIHIMESGSTPIQGTDIRNRNKS